LTPLSARAAVFGAGVALLVAACSAHAPAAVPLPQVPASPYQLGIDLDFYWHPDQNVPALVTQEAAYARRAPRPLRSLPQRSGRSARRGSGPGCGPC
jgi:hypothetical protein